MFFRRKKDSPASKQAPEPLPVAAPAEPTLTPAGVGPPSTQFLTGEAGRDRRTVQVLLEAIARVSESRDLESLLIDIVDSSIELTGAERGLLVMRGAKDGEHLVRVARLRGKKPVVGDLRYSTTIAGRVLAEARPLRAQVHSESEALELGRSVYDLKLRAVMCVPLASAGQGDAPLSPPKGVLYVDSRAATRQFSQPDLSLFAALAQYISIAMTNAQLQLDSLEKVRLEQSLELASAIQRDLMPRVPSIPGWDLAGWYGPAEQTGADFYDFLRLGKGSLALVVGDVTGHGIGPALITASAQGSLRTSLRLNPDPGEVVTLLNQDLCERIEDGRFLTLFLAALDENGEVRALNAGHSPPLLWSQVDRSMQEIKMCGPALGMIADEVYRAHPPLAMHAGDVLVAYTDGLVEARTAGSEDDFFGEEGLKRVLDAAAGAGLSAREICTRLAEAALEQSGGVREDDITVVVARRA
ncbi:MAG: SpoIIE family protein phosphatase [Planctomycetes bacterium]|nr:SpoIIE family protein phosphatase [Planctomycetota bacterium]